MSRHSVFSVDFAGIHFPRDRRIAPSPARTLPLVVLRFALPHVSLAAVVVQTPAGGVVRTLAHGTLAAGEHAIEWRGEDDRGDRAPSGTYVIRLEAEGRTLTSRWVVVE